MTPTLQILIVLLAVAAAVAVIAARLKIPAAILLVVTGVGLALVPGLPTVELAPEFVLLMVLPPLIYSAAVAMSWREFKFNLRPISLLAVGCVIFTTVAVAAACHWLLGMPWPVGFVLGAIISPPDAVAPLAIARRLQVPHRFLVVIEGEGLANDATALILYRFAVAAVSIGTFSIGPAVGTFAAIVVGEVMWGVGVGWLSLRLRRWVKDPRIEIGLSLLTPYLAFWPPEELGGSGVLATVVAGLYISWNGLRLISSATRLQGIFFWDLLIYMIEGMVFLITGLQARTLVERMGGTPVIELLVPAVIVCAVIIAARFIWMFPATYLPRWLFSSVRKKDPSPPWTMPFALAFTGVRGIVSLAAALAIPFSTESGAAFPYRDMILFLTFCVILVTLVGQGLLLPLLIRALGLAHEGRKERRAERSLEHLARRYSIEAALNHLERLTRERNLPDEVTAPLRTRHRDRLSHIMNRSDGNDGHRKITELREEVEFLLIEAERNHVNDLSQKGKLSDDARRRIERELDLREASLANQRGNEPV
jgi:monovalent cation/hydrogen antiporter